MNANVMIKYRDFDTGEIWTLEELKDAYKTACGDYDFFRKHQTFNDYLDHMLSLGNQKIGGLEEIHE